MNLIWATRGRRWGFRFLRDGGHADPLPVYERAFADAGDDEAVCVRAGDAIALRFPDPEGRRDDAGRVIPHEFVILDPPGDIATVAEGIRVVWPLVSDVYARVWDES
ncbi:hypothetical protein [Microbacterium karelineae]|uniref:hypothetical protein n=1 Tax=Microbacterium karelineae TaxID=2654283 RepID=UPI0012EA67D2|nr:hypothetical protein [Microbacterium karelineae]